MKAIGEVIGNGEAVRTAMSETGTAARRVTRPTLDELDTSWHPTVARAVATARDWSRRRQAVPYASLILLAAGVEGSREATGFGCGKTHIARACLWSLCYMLDDEPLAPVGRFFTADDLIQRLDAGTRVGVEMGGPIVVIDDVGTEQAIPFIAEQRQAAERHSRWFRAVDYAYQHGVALILTGNMRLWDLADHVGGRAWSRLLEMAPAGFMVDMTGCPDYRRRQGGR